MSSGMTSAAWVTLLIGTVGWIVVTRFKVGRLIGPMSISVLLLLSIYGVRPILMEASNAFDFYGIDIVRGVQGATAIGLTALVSLFVGYFLAHANHRAAPTSLVVSEAPSTRSEPDAIELHSLLPNTAFRIALTLVASWFVAVVILGGGIGYLATLFAGRSADTKETFTNVPVLIVALPVVAGLLVALIRFRIERVRAYTSRESLAYWAIAALCAIPPSALGNRRFLIPVLVAVLIGASRRNWSSRPKPLWVACAIVAFLIIAIIPFVRSAGSRAPGANLLTAMQNYFETVGIKGILDNFFLSYDTEMFNYVSYLSVHLGWQLPFGWGRGTFGEALLAPLPAALAPVQTWSNTLLTQIFGSGCSEGVCPVPSVVGTLYYDFSFGGVILGMLLIGLLFYRVENRMVVATGNELTILLSISAFAAVIVRGNPISQLWIALQCLIVLMVCDWIAKRLTIIRAPVPVSRVRTNQAHVIRGI